MNLLMSDEIDAVAAGAICELIDSQGTCCALSGQTLVPESTELDFITHPDDGGACTFDNLQAVHETAYHTKYPEASDLDRELILISVYDSQELAPGETELAA